MTPQPLTGDQTTQAIRAFLASYDASDVADREVAYRLRERLHGEICRREREQYPEWIVYGGEGR